jgi:hypothetical protein
LSEQFRPADSQSLDQGQQTEINNAPGVRVIGQFRQGAFQDGDMLVL